MKKTIKGFTGLISVIVLTLMFGTNEVMAAGSVSISASAESVEVGGEVSVTIKAENPDGAAEKPEISVKYDASVLTFDSCDKETGGGGGGLITLADTEATLKFKGTASGTTEVSVSAVLDGDGADVPTDKVTIAVGDGVNAEGGAAEGVAPTSNIAEGLIAINGTEKMISTTFPNEILPVGFHKADFTYQEQMLESAQFDMGDMTLLYVTDAGGANGEFCIYDQATDTFTDFVSINGIESRFIVIMIPDESVVVPDGFIKATLQWNGKTLTAYAINGSSTGADAEGEGSSEVTANGVSTSDFFLLYAMSSDGNKGWYMYDMKEGTYQRYLEFESAEDAEPSVLDVFDSDKDSYKKQSHTRLIIICVLAVILVVLAILLINFFIKLREYQSYEYIDEDEEDDDEEENDHFSQRTKGKGNINRQPSEYEHLSADEMRARRYEAGEDLEETGDISPVSKVGYETQDMVFEDLSLPDPKSVDDDDEEDEEEDSRRGRRGKNKKEKKKGRFAKWYEDDDFGDDDEDEEDDEDDDDEDDEDEYEERRSLFGRKKKKMPEPVEAKQLDWSEMQNVMEGADEDERRPMTGTRRPVSTPKMIVTEPPTPAPVRPVYAPGEGRAKAEEVRIAEPEPEEQMIPPKPVTPKYEQPIAKKIPEPLKQQTYEQPMQQHYEQPVQHQVPQQHYEQPRQPQQHYEQPRQPQQQYYEQPMQAQQQYYGQQMSQQYYEQPSQPQQPYYGQQMQQQYYEQPVQAQQQYYEPQMPQQQQYYDPSILQPSQAQYREQPVQRGVSSPAQPQGQKPMQGTMPRTEPKLDLDDDFEFEFIDVN